MPNKEKLITAGGQAVIEGVMMRSTDHTAIAVRKPDGTISLKKDKMVSLSKKYKILGWPLIRGVISLAEMMVLGIKALNWSANESGEEEEQLSAWHIVLSLFLSLVFAVALFKFAPLFIAQLLQNNVQLVADNYWLFNLIDGIVKIALFVSYIAIIGLMSDVKRLFQYHGAEHMAVHCYEARKKLTVKNVQKYSTIHPRCGTSFILIVLLLSVAVYTFIPQNFTFIAKLGTRILLLPFIAGVSYEILKLAGKYRKNIILRAISAPGMWVERLTTRKPTNEMVEVAIKALKAVVKVK